MKNLLFFSVNRLLPIDVGDGSSSEGRQRVGFFRKEATNSPNSPDCGAAPALGTSDDSIGPNLFIVGRSGGL
jgi:hypothetical protein